MKSPCTRQCFFDYEKQYCTGCFRHTDDLWDWFKKTDEEKMLILERAEKIKQEKIELENKPNQ